MLFGPLTLLAQFPEASPAGATIGGGSAHVVTGTTTGWFEDNTDSDGFTYIHSSNISASFFDQDPSQGVISQLFVGNDGSDTVALLGAGVPTVGTTYVGGVNGARVYVYNSTKGGFLCDSAKGDSAEAWVDQISESQGALTSLAISYACETTSGDDYLGAFAQNIVPTTPHQGYYVYESDGTITGYGNDNYLTYFGDLSATSLNKPIVGMTQTADGAGYWLVASDGGDIRLWRRSVLRFDGIDSSEPADCGDGSYSRWRWLLARCFGRRDLLLWGCPLLRINRVDPSEQAHRGRGRNARRGRLLVSGLRWRDLLLWRRPFLWINRVDPFEQADRGRGDDGVWEWLLAGRFRRRHLRLR